jgi:hypothetical protein
MAMIRCNFGHFFDPAKHSSCPYCGVKGLDLGKTQRQETAGTSTDDMQNKTLHLGEKAYSRPEEGKTVRIVQKKLGIDPVVGWLVCIEGPDKGRDYRIKSERNFIGRSHSMDICVEGDDTISRENHAIVSFNPKTFSFKFMPGESRSLIYLNSEEVNIPMEMKTYDVLEMGQSKFLFIPLCGETFQWTSSPETAS